MTGLIDKIHELYEKYGIFNLNPFYVCITQDCRGSYEILDPDLTNHIGINIEGFYHPDMLKVNRGEPDDMERIYDALCVQPDEYDDSSVFELVLPLILAETGDIIWGIQCFWRELDNKELDIESRFYRNDALKKLEQAIERQLRQAN